MRKSTILFELFRQYLISEGVREDHIISLALDDDKNITYRDPFALPEYVRNIAQNSSKKYYVSIDESEPSPPDSKNQMELPKLVVFGLSNS